MNLLRDLPPGGPNEIVERLAGGGAVRIERIVSHGHVSPPDFWYAEIDREFVMVVAGAARLRFAEPDETVALAAGDWLDIAPLRRHRVEWTDPACPTVWLAVYYRPEEPR